MTFFNAKGLFLSFCEWEMTYCAIITCALRHLSITGGKQLSFLFQYMIIYSVYVHASDNGFKQIFY